MTTLSNFLLETSPIFEHLGNLNEIDKELFHHLVGTEKVKTSQGGKTGWETYFSTSKNNSTTYRKYGDVRSTNKIPKEIGRDSKIEYISVSSELLISQVPKKYFAAIVLINDKQVGMIYQYTKDTLGVVLTKEFCRSKEYSMILPSTKRTPQTFDDFFDRAGNNQYFSKSILKATEAFQKLQWTIDNTPDVTKVKKYPSPLPDLNVILIHHDESRKEVQSTREVAKKGITIVPKQNWVTLGYKEKVTHTFVQAQKDLTSHLNYRLNAFKNDRTPTVQNEEEILNKILETNYIKKIKFMDSVYNLNEKKIDFDDLHLGIKSRNQSFIIYKSESLSEFSAVYRDKNYVAASEEWNKDREKFAKNHAPTPPDGEDSEQWISKWGWDNFETPRLSYYQKHNCCPVKLKIHLRMVNGKIEPYHVEYLYSEY